jgi:urease accessory protein
MPPHEIDGTGHHHSHHHRHAQGGPGVRPLRIGVGGPVGSGKTTLVGALCTLLRDELSLAVVTNDIFTTEDADALRAAGVLPIERIVAVETGCCPHTAIRDDIAANLDAVEELEAQLGDVDLTLVESGGDNLTAIFSQGLVDAQIFVLDTAGGDDVPRKGAGRRAGRPARHQQDRPRAVRRLRRRPHAGRRHRAAERQARGTRVDPHARGRDRDRRLGARPLPHLARRPGVATDAGIGARPDRR